MGQIGIRYSRPLAFAMAPVLLPQGMLVRGRTPRLPEAGGERTGAEGAEHAASAEPLSVLVFGESTAAGVGVVRQAEGLAPALASRLAQLNRRPVNWRVVGRSGCTVRQALSRLVPEIEGGPFDIIVVALGINDLLTLRSAGAWREDVTELVAALRPRLRPAGVIVLTGIPDVSDFPALPQPMRGVMALHARRLDLGLDRIARNDPDVIHVVAPAVPRTEGSMYASDGFHPGPGGYRLWGEHLAEVLIVLPA